MCTTFPFFNSRRLPANYPCVVFQLHRCNYPHTYYTTYCRYFMRVQMWFLSFFSFSFLSVLRGLTFRYWLADVTASRITRRALSCISDTYTSNIICKLFDAPISTVRKRATGNDRYQPRNGSVIVDGTLPCHPLSVTEFVGVRCRRSKTNGRRV